MKSIAPFAENSYLEIVRGNDETEFGRSACLDLNPEDQNWLLLTCRKYDTICKN